MNHSPSIWQITSRLFWYYLPIATVGFLLNIWYSVTIAFCLVVIISNYRQMLKLTHWLWHQRGIYPPKAHGLWSSVFDGIYGQQRRNVKKRTELSTIVRRFRLGAESLPDAVLLFDEHRHILWCNQLAQDMLGLKWPTDKGNRLDNLVRYPEFIDYLDEENFSSPYDIPSPTKEHIRLEVRVVPYETNKWTLLIRDITHLHQLEQMRKDFIANVSHELKTPLTVMRGYLEMTPNKNDLSDEMWQKAQSMMMQQATRMNDLVEQLLSLSKLEGQNPDFSPEFVDIPALLDVLTNEAKSISNGRHIIDSKIDTNLCLLGQSTELRSAFSNLVFNAIRYTPDNGKITILWQATSSGKAKFSVIDTGPGIQASHIPRLTERFYRVDEARARHTGGAGLGLSIVKHALNHHQSKLEISSELGKGSEFSFRFPSSLTTTRNVEKAVS